VIESGLYQFATQTSAITDCLGKAESVFFSALMKQSKLPALVIHRVSLTDPATTLDLQTSAPALVVGRFQFSSFGEDNNNANLISTSGYLCAAQLSRTLRLTLQAMVGLPLPDGTVITDYQLNDEFDADYEVGGTGYVFRRLLDVTLWFEEGGAAPEVPLPFQRYSPTQSPDGSRTVFTFAGEAASSAEFQLFWDGLLQNEGGDYTIVIGGGVTQVTMTEAPLSGQPVFAYF
jgi:hypothetical protein